MDRDNFIASQNSLIEAGVGRFARPGDRHALVDFPNYPNVGDSAIWLGATATLRRLTGRSPIFVSVKDTACLDALADRIGGGTIYLTGGGNFGDLWTDHQEFREAILNRFRSNRIVQLPQTIHFQSGEAAERCAQAIARHGDFHLLVRDAESDEFARRHFVCSVAMVPDCAFALGALQPSGPPRHALCGLLRTDTERRTGDITALGDLRPHVQDWLTEPPGSVPARLARVAAGIGRSGMLSRAAARGGLFELIAKRRLERGIRILSGGSQTVTDRLHGHILCVLLGIPHVVLDNSYGKIGAYRRAWTGGVEGHAMAADAVAAAGALADLPRRPWLVTA